MTLISIKYIHWL